MNSNKLRVFEAFAGYGGASFALKRLGIPFEVVGYSEIDKNAIKIYELNHPNVKNYGDITKINPYDLPDFDVFTGGFPCQSFSIAGKKLGEKDERGVLYKDIIRICEVKKPKYIILENVEGLLIINYQTFEKILNELNRIGYYVKWQVLNSKDYGIPQNRKRVWIIGFLNKNEYDKFDFPKPIDIKYDLSEFIDKNVDASYYYSNDKKEKILSKTKKNLNQDKVICYNKKIDIFSDKYFYTFTVGYPDNILVVEPNCKIRKLTINERIRLMGFKENELKTDGIGKTYIKRLLGNGWDINVIEKIMVRLWQE